MTSFTGTIPTIASGDTTTVPTNLAIYRDALKGLSEAWTSYTVTTTNFAIGNGTITGRYARINKTVFLRISVVAGGTTTQGAGSAQTFLLPAAAHATGEQVLTAKLFTGAANYVGVAVISASGTTLSVQVPPNSTTSSIGFMSSATPNVGTTGNLAITGVYETA